MKKLFLIYLTAILVISLTACGATAFSLNGAEMEAYAIDMNAEFSDISSLYSDQTNIEGVYQVDTEDARVQLWDFDSAESAKAWFENNQAALEAQSTSEIGSYTSGSGDYTYKVNGVTYELIFYKDQGVYSYSESASALEDALADLNIKQ